MTKTITIEVPFKSAGNVILNKPVQFEVHEQEDHFKAIPQLNPDEIRLANLPVELLFKMERGKAVSLRGIKDGNYHVIEAIGNKLKDLALQP